MNNEENQTITISTGGLRDRVFTFDAGHINISRRVDTGIVDTDPVFARLEREDTATLGDVPVEVERVEETPVEEPLAVLEEVEGPATYDETAESEEMGVSKECVYRYFRIASQREKHFEKRVYIFENGEVSTDHRKGLYIYRLFLGSVSCTASSFYSDSSEIYLKGEDDFCRDDKILQIERDHFDRVLKCLNFVNVEVKEFEIKEEVANNEELPKVSYVFTEEPNEDEIKEMISKVDLKTFNNIIRARILRDDGSVGKITNKWAENYLKDWAYAKYRFYKMFGNSLTLETTIEVEKDAREIEIEMNEIKGKFPLYAPIFDKISSYAVKDNIINSDNINYRFYEDKRVKSGMSFTKFISLYNNKDLDIEVSKIYQNKGKAHLTISINPIDYLTVSINKSGWQSCHNLFDGCYRNGPLSYMIDRTSLVAYRSNVNVEYLECGKKFEWNSKNWRQMIYVSEHNSAMVFSRQYPNENWQIAKAVRVLLENKVSEYFTNSANKWKVYNNVCDCDVEVEKDEWALLYNDVYEGYTHKVVKAKDDISTGRSTIIIGSEVVWEDEHLEDGEDSLW